MYTYTIFLSLSLTHTHAHTQGDKRDLKIILDTESQDSAALCPPTQTSVLTTAKIIFKY